MKNCNKLKEFEIKIDFLTGDKLNRYALNYLTTRHGTFSTHKGIMIKKRWAMIVKVIRYESYYDYTRGILIINL